MQRPLLINGSLLAVIVILGGAAWLSIQDQNTDRRTHLTSLQPDQINQITLNNNTGPSLVLERRHGVWMMTSPYQAPGKNSRIQRLLEITRSISLSHFQTPQDLSGYGLAPPQATLTLNQTRIEMGSTHPMNQRRYLRVGDQIHLINDRFPHHLQARAEDFISHSLLPTASSIQTINTPEWQLSFTATGKTTLTPSDPDISSDALNRKGDQWRLARASRVVPAPKMPGSGKIEIQFRDRQQPMQFEILRSEQQTLLIRRELGLAYIIPEGSKLLNPPQQDE
ncbi:MAG: DUF4340 domain-containing protein [Gammaproteobacteria bacterium]|nr:DUF4340 domain-containing protein [Gammaproteobacteria bacterium]